MPKHAKVDIRTLNLATLTPITEPNVQATAEPQHHIDTPHIARELRTVAWCSIPLFILLIAGSVMDTKWPWVVTTAQWFASLGN